MMLYSNLLTDSGGIVVEGAGGGGSVIPPYIPPPPEPLPPPPGGTPVLQPKPTCSTCGQVPKPQPPPPSQVITVQVPGSPGATTPGAGLGATFAQMLNPENMGLLLLVIALGLAAAAAYNEQRKGR